jgi:hypothetical protein
MDSIEDAANLEACIESIKLTFQTLPISAVNVNYSKIDENIVPLNTYLKDIVSDI